MKITKRIAEHTPSWCLLIGSEFEIEPTDAEIIEKWNEYYDDYVSIVHDDDEWYDKDDMEQEHDEDYTIVELDFNITPTKTLAEYEDYVTWFESNRDHFYGYAMNNWGKKEFQKMYGDNDTLSYQERITSNGSYTIN